MDKVVHFHIPAEDMERAKKFYSEIFGWKTIPTGMDNDYTIVQTAATDKEGMLLESGAINGALYLRESPGEHPIIIINVPSIADYLEKIQSSGGGVVTPNSPVGDFGFYAEIKDSEGNLVGLFQDLKTV
jgi:predicted enzyme related to lactoylglutathione lyase